MIRILRVRHSQEITQAMRDIGVDPYGSQIMLPKAISYLVRINSLSNITANILKQEMLSLGGDVAVSRLSLTGKANKTDCLLMGNLAQIKRLQEKLQKQPFRLGELASSLSGALSNYQKDKFIFKLGSKRLNLGSRTYIMGIVNLTPDSFSGDGLYQASDFRLQTSEIQEYIDKMIADGADIIDIGGESSRPGARPVPLREELARTIPVVKKIAKKIKVPLSIDTRKPEVARQALDNGAVIVNDIGGLRNPLMAKVAARYKASVVIMHMQGKPATMQRNPHYDNLIFEIMEFLSRGIEIARQAAVREEQIIIDPGIGFGKTLQDNLEILKNLAELKVLGKPILVGPSRKSFLGEVLAVPVEERTFGTAATCVLAAQNGASIVRVHDVKAVKQALAIADQLNR